MDRTEAFLNRITIRHLKLLDAIGVELNLSRAALRLNTSQPAVSQALREMEALLEARLFDRSTRRISLTPQGVLLWRHARRILGELDYAAQEFEAARSGAQVEFSLGLIGQVPASLLARAIARMATKHRLRIAVREGAAANIMQELSAGHVDMVISHLATGVVTTPLEIEILYEDDTCLVANTDHPLVKNEAVGWEALREQRWILPSAELPVRSRVDREMLLRGVPDLSDALEASSPHVVLALLNETGAVAVMNRKLADDYVRRGMLAIIPMDFKLGKARFALIRRQDAQPSAALLAMWTAIESEFKGHTATI